MTASPSGFRTPYTLTPGGSTPSPDVTPEEGKGELRTFFWLSILNTSIIAGAGIGVWWFVH